MSRSDSIHMPATEVRRVVEQLDEAQGQARRDAMARLAWRPAWAIRSRRGALAALREMLGLAAKRP